MIMPGKHPLLIYNLNSDKAPLRKKNYQINHRRSVITGILSEKKLLCGGNSTA